MRVLLLPALLTLLIVPARAEDWTLDGVTATWENDLFGGLDRHYTNGVELSLFGDVPAGELGFFLGERGGRWRLTLGQRIYTPEDLDAPDLLTGDRPYGGWLWLGFSLRRWGADAKWTDRVGVELGLLGPESGAQVVHETVHSDLTGSSPPRGWEHQLETEVGLRFTYELAVTLVRREFGVLGYEITPRLAASFGNVQTFAGLGADLRVGRLPPLSPDVDEFALFLALGGEGRLVLHDVFLDGSLLHTGGHRVTARRVVFDLRAGLTLQLPCGLVLAYTHTLRSVEFAGQGGVDQFGSFSVTWTW
ncbi:MAG TPA: hypothetical protein DEA08_14320 [Planctomycetes bacterium]|nr:hypothetical protein [Planctomycetota bacterium]